MLARGVAASARRIIPKEHARTIVQSSYATSFRSDVNSESRYHVGGARSVLSFGASARAPRRLEAQLRGLSGDTWQQEPVLLTPPTDKQISYLRSLASDKGINIPQSTYECKIRCSEAIDTILREREASPKQLALVEKLSRQYNIPGPWNTSFKVVKEWIDNVLSNPAINPQGSKGPGGYTPAGTGYSGSGRYSPPAYTPPSRLDTLANELRAAAAASKGGASAEELLECLMAAMRSGKDVPERVWSEPGAAAIFIVEQGFLDAAATEFLSEAGPRSAEMEELLEDGEAGAEELDDAGSGGAAAERRKPEGVKVRNSVLMTVHDLFEALPNDVKLGPTLHEVVKKSGYSLEDVEEALKDQIGNGLIEQDDDGRYYPAGSLEDSSANSGD